jgi:glycosyltransferase involved in cell wall biosynthesis
MVQLRVFGRALLQVLLAILSGRIDIVHVHSASRGSFWRKSLVCALARARSIPYVFHLHSGEFPGFYENECGSLGKAWIRHTLRGASAVIVLTESWRKTLDHIVPEARTVVVPNGIPTPSGTTENDASNTVLFLGRLRAKKGIFDLIDAIPAVLARCPDAHFVLAGDGELDRARERIEALGVADSVTLTGWIDGEQKDRALASAAALVLPSYFEGFPVCILEAMAHRVAVVASAVGGIPDVLDQGSCGRLIAPGAPNEISDSISELLLDREVRHKLVGAAYRRYVQTYSLNRVINLLEEVYRNASNERGVKT